MREVSADGPPAVPDPDTAHPIPGAWRPMLRAVVERFVAGDFGLTEPVPGVAPISTRDAEQMRTYVADYGATLVELPEATWATSVAQWTGAHWDVLVDLWTAEEGRSDLVLSGRMLESSSGPRLTVHLIYVP